MKLKKIFFFTTLIFCLGFPIFVNASIGVVGELTHELVVNLEQSYSGFITIRNSDKLQREVKIYQRDYSFSCEGTSKYGEPGTSERSNANYITFTPHKLTIPPQSTADVNYTIIIPRPVDEDSVLVGTYWSMLMIEEIPESSPESESFIPETDIEDKIKMSIGVKMRYAVQIITHIGDTGIRELKFLDAKLIKDEKKRFLQVDVENVGERHLRPFLSVEIYDEMGMFVGKYRADKKHIYPGTSVRYNVDLSDVRAGKYKVLVVADAGGDDLFGINYSLKFKK